jgi:hypothetical protein
VLSSMSSWRWSAKAGPAISAAASMASGFFILDSLI